MENQGKRLLLAVGLALAVMLVWNMVFPPKKEEPKPASDPAAVVDGATPGAVTPTPALPEEPEAPRGEEQRIVLEFPRFTAAFSSYGGALVSWKLADKRFERDASNGELIPQPGEALGTTGDVGAFYLDFAGSPWGLPRRAEWVGARVSDTEVRYTLSTDALDIEKLYTVVPDAFLVRMAVKITVKPGAGRAGSQSLVVSTHGFQDPAQSAEGSMQVAARVFQSSTLRVGADEVVLTPVQGVAAAPRFESSVHWTGFEHPYLLAAFAPNHQGQPISKYTFQRAPGLMRTEIVFPPTSYAPGTPIVHEVAAYLGPKNYSDLAQADEVAGFSTGFQTTVDFGWFGVIGRPLLWLMLRFYELLGNWGLAIMLLTVLVKAATLYWTTKSMRSMKAMAALAPEMKALQERYKDDRQRLQVETMALYKTHQVNPIAGCLPLFLQMPIWIALYRMLSSAGELYQSPFIPGWINDLTATDPYYILPVVLVVTMFVQARLTPTTGTGAQQKMLQYGMPLMFGVMSFFFPAGLTLYIFTNTVLSALHSIWMNKYDKKSLEITARLKAAQDAAAAKSATTAKPAGGPGAKGPTKAKVYPAKPVIDVEGDEVNAGEGDEDDDSAGPTSGKPGVPGRSAGNRSRRNKKRRR